MTRKAWRQECDATDLIWSGSRERWMLMLSSRLLFLTLGPQSLGGVATVRVTVPSSVRPFWKPHGHTPSCFSKMIQNPFKLATKIHCHRNTAGGDTSENGGLVIHTVFFPHISLHICIYTPQTILSLTSQPIGGWRWKRIWIWVRISTDYYLHHQYWGAQLCQLRWQSPANTQDRKHP